jgi:C4-type Zn-finger protein
MSKQNEMDVILRDPEYAVNKTTGVQGILARIWRTILRDKNMSPAAFETLLARSVINAKYAVGKDSRVAKFFTQGNLRRELVEPKMTFKVFMKGIKLLNAKKMTITIMLTSPSGKESIHSTTVDLGEVNNEDLLHDENDQAAIEEITSV